MTFHAEKFSSGRLILEAATRQLRDRDEGELRILDIASETNQSPSVIYSHFRSRQGLIDAAYASLYEHITNEVIRMVTEVVAQTPPNDPILVAFHQYYTVPDRTVAIKENRGIRLRVRAACLTRTSLRRRIAEIDASFVERMRAICDDLIARGDLGHRLSSAEWAAFFESCWLYYGPITANLLNDNDGWWLDAALSMADGSKAGDRPHA